MIMRTVPAVLRTAAWLVVVLLVLPLAAQAERIKIQSLDELPVHTYALKGSVSDLLKSDADFQAFAAQLQADVEGDLAKYEIPDKATLQRMYSTLVALHLLKGDDAPVPELIEKVKALEDKEANRLTTGLLARSLIAARKTADPAQDPEAYREAFRAKLSELAGALPWDIVQDQIQASKGRAEIFSENLIMGMVQAQLDPVVAKSGELSGDLAQQVASLKLAIAVMLPLKAEQIAVYQGLIDAHKVEKEDIWPARDVTLEASRDLQPVIVGIWDSGVDTKVYGKSMWTNAKERPDGKDDDGNGFVDDIHGIAFDVQGNPSTDLLHPKGDVGEKVWDGMEYMKGLTDLQASIDSPEASELKAHIASLDPGAVNEFLTVIGFTGLFAHGTHVAGIATAGNPFAEVLCARISFDYHPIPVPVTKEMAQRHVASYARTTRYFHDAGVRVVNMSWGWSYEEVLSSLEANGVGATAEERADLAREIIGILSKGLKSAMAATPDILYVAAAGNEDSDVEFNVVIPSSFELPNLLVVGAVDQAGRRTSFTSTGKNVVVYANGFEVESYVPGGQRMAMSGTSMASPNACNLAAKLIAIDPSLTPERTITLIEKGADTLEGQEDLKLMNPQQSVKLLESKAM
jgi:subtilisin family serine protease